MSKRSKKRFLWAAAILITAVLCVYLYQEDTSPFSTYKRCNTCEILEAKSTNGLPPYKGIVTITPNKGIQFTEHQHKRTYQLQPCDADCQNKLYKEIADHYQFAQNNKEALWLVVWGIKDEKQQLIDINAYVLVDSVGDN